jgi:cell division protein FtsW
VPYRWLRVLSYLHPEKEGAMATEEIPQAILNAKYQVSQSLITIGSGGLWGKGLGQGVMKLEFLPEDTTDFIFAVIGEELGLMGVFFVVLFYLALTFCVMKIVLKTDNRFGKLVAFGLGLIIVTQAAMNMLVVTGLAPVTGISLPFISHGGSGLVVLAVAAGIIINIAKEDIIIMHLKEAT